MILPEEWRMYSRAVPAFRNITGVFIPFGNTHYNTISMSVNTKTQDIVLLHKKPDHIHQKYGPAYALMKYSLYQLQFPKLFINLRFCICERTAVINNCIRIFPLFRYR